MCDIVCVYKAMRCLQGYEMQHTCRGLRVYPELRGTVHKPFLFTFLHASHLHRMTTANHFSASAKKKKKVAFICVPSFLFHKVFLKWSLKRSKKSCLHCLLFPLCGIKLHFEGVGWWLGGGGWGVLSCITHREEQGKQTGPDSSNRGSCSAGWGTLGVNQS